MFVPGASEDPGTDPLVVARADHLAPELRRDRWRAALYFGTKPLYRALGRLPNPYKTAYSIDGRPVLFTHAPKSAGTSLRAILGCVGNTHAMPRHVMRRRAWHSAFVVTSVRDPFDRFVSGYTYFVKSPFSGVLAKAHGTALRRLSAADFLEFIQQYPEKLGPQVLWATYPDPTKPRADLILRVEESAGWIDALRGAGIEVAADTVVHRNSSREAGVGVPALLGCTADEVEALRDRVADVYAADYAAFGYVR